jgi:hypothetical protein
LPKWQLMGFDGKRLIWFGYGSFLALWFVRWFGQGARF